MKYLTQEKGQKGHKLFYKTKRQKLVLESHKGFQSKLSYAVDNSTCYKVCNKKLDTQHNFETKSTHLNLENRPTSQFELKTLLIPENSKLLLNLINKSTIFSFVKNNWQGLQKK